MKIRGIIPPVVTWFSEDNRLDLEAQSKHLDFLIKEGVHGIFLQGSSGEFPYLSLDERKAQAGEVVAHVAKRLPVLVGVSANTSSDAVELAQHAEKIGAEGIVATTPYYWVLSEDQIIDYYLAIGKASTLPLLAYNFPALTGHDLTPDLVVRMAASIPTLCGIKDTVDSQRHLREMIHKVKDVRPDFLVFAGFDEFLLPTLATGGDGVIGATANFAPHISLRLYRAFLDGDLSTVMDCHQKICRLMAIYTLGSPPISAIKTAVLSVGMKGSPVVRSPLPPLDQAGYRKLLEVLEASGL
jgi:4-hydroxy-tetrahydrodipicolinate synthase